MAYDILDPTQTYEIPQLLFDLSFKIYLQNFISGTANLTPAQAIQKANDFITAYNDNAGRSNVTSDMASVVFEGGVSTHHKKGDPPPDQGP